MPTAPRRPCTAPLCRGFQPCPKHPRSPSAQTRERLYDRIRGTAASRGYDARHRRWRGLVLAADPVCRACGIAESTIADHVKPLEDGGDWSLENGQGLCRPCHNRKTSAESAARRGEGRVKSSRPALSEPARGSRMCGREMHQAKVGR